MIKAFSVTVIIPTYNRATLLSRALQSVFAQTRAPQEVIVVDDGSTDCTEQIVQEKFPQARYIFQENQGVSAARNKGIQKACGEWIAFLDSDDEWLPQKLEKQFMELQSAPHFQVCHTNEIWIRNGRRVNPMKKHAKYGGHIFQHCLALCLISPSSVLLRRSLFESVGFFDETLPACEDYDLWLRITARYPVLYLEEPCIRKYGGHNDQLSRKYWGMDRFRIYALEKILNTNLLTLENKQIVTETLLQKIDIYTQGARKRGKEKEARLYEKKKMRYL